MSRDERQQFDCIRPYACCLGSLFLDLYTDEYYKAYAKRLGRSGRCSRLLIPRKVMIEYSYANTLGIQTHVTMYHYTAVGSMLYGVYYLVRLMVEIERRDDDTSSVIESRSQEKSKKKINTSIRGILTENQYSQSHNNIDISVQSIKERELISMTDSKLQKQSSRLVICTISNIS